MKKYKSRDEVPEKYKWDLTDICPSNEQFKKDIKKCSNDLKKIEKFVGCTKDSNNLLKYLEYDISLCSKIMNLEIYAMTLSDSDLNDSNSQELLGMAEKLSSDYVVFNSFFEPELLSLNKKEYKDLYKNKELLEYKPYLDKLYRRKEHVLNENEEKLVAKLTKTLSSYGNISSTLLNNNHNYGTIEDNNGEIIDVLSTNYNKLMQDLPRDKRKKLYYQFYRVISDYASTNASLLNNYVSTQDTLASIYKYESTWDEKLFNMQLTNKVFDTLVSVCVDKKDVLKKFYKIKEKVLNISELMPWDGPLPLYKISKEYTIEEAQDLVIKATSILGDDYTKHLREVFDARCIDYCQYKGKCSGGYNVSGLDLKNSKILLSFNGNLDSVSTIAHEAGHHVNHQYLYEANKPLYREHSSIIAEVASLTNECLLSAYLVNNGTKEEALAGLSNIIGVINSNLFGATQEGDLEREFYKYVHDGGTLTKDYLNDLCKNSREKFYPSKLKDEYQNVAWARRSHYYMFFYLFSYAICISVATFVAGEILNGNNDMLDKYMKFLKTGSDTNIVDTFKILGVDLEDRLVYEKAIDFYEVKLKEFNKIYKEV